MIERLRRHLAVTPRLLAVYVCLYIPVGFCMNEIGKLMQIAEFANWWQVLTCYGLYLIPASLVIRHRAWFDQYLWGLLALALLEIPGYALGTSIAHEGNLIDQILGTRNFSLAMVIFFAAYIPAGNAAAAALERAIFSTGAPPEAAPGK